jgi:hypothetical protein
MVSQVTGFVANRVMKTAGRKPTIATRLSAAPRAFWSRKREQILLDNKRGWKSTKIRPKVKCFLLTSPLIELFRQFGSTFPDSRLAGREFYWFTVTVRVVEWAREPAVAVNEMADVTGGGELIKVLLFPHPLSKNRLIVLKATS